MPAFMEESSRTSRAGREIFPSQVMRGKGSFVWFLTFQGILECGRRDKRETEREVE